MLARIVPSRKFIVYSAIGLCGAGLDVVLFTILVNWVGTHYLFANAVGTVGGIVNNFILNRHFNFRQHDRPFRRFAAFFAVGMAGLLLSSVLLALGVEFLGFGELPVKLLSIFAVALFQYTLNREWSFAPGKSAEADLL